MRKMNKIEMAKCVESAAVKSLGYLAFIGFALLGVIAFGEYLIKAGLVLD